MPFLKKLLKFGWYGCVAHCVFEYCGDFVLCDGPSMEPTIHTNDVVLTEHYTPLWRRPQQGDVVIVRSPRNPNQFICKRVVAVPGEKIPGQLKHLVKFVSSEKVPKGKVWLEGDNKSNSTDSKNYGPVPIGLIRGRAIATIWPPSAVQLLAPDLYAYDTNLKPR
ncbi:unnamed protein product [Notodromas monacha]|uniref:Mitochondrial inner membrane protease subunit n=1 Tax=Notodromas monacha TaxID=399045 RepID=A0A7R9BN71_9CRUS|nr:unnamed protein product [Notodromas monacha]CAG0918600.1 unnamed protein product [Notodromas monacha]